MRTNIYHTHYCKDLDITKVGESIVVSGWIENIRDHGGVLFLDLRDNTDTLQVVSNDDSIFRGLTKESVIRVEGTIRKRSEETYNSKIRTGEIELLVEKLEVLGRSKNMLPFEIISSKSVKEDVRLKYRYLDMRNKKVTGFLHPHLRS